MSRLRAASLLFVAWPALILPWIISGCGGASGAEGGGGTLTPLAITTTALPKAVTGSAYSARIQATGGKLPYTWRLALFPGQTASDVLPTGLSFASDGSISGTPAAGCYSVWFPQILVQDAASQTAGIGLELDCVAPLVFSSSTLPDGNIALPYSLFLPIQGGLPPYQFALAGGSLPPGMSVDPKNGLQGTPTAPGAYSITLQVSDSGFPTLTATQAFNLTIDNNLVLPKTSLPDAVQNVPYLEQIQPAGGTPPYHFALGQYSSLPSGLALDNSSGNVSGTPTTVSPNAAFIQITITDSAPNPATLNAFVTLNVQPPLSFQTTTLPDGVHGLNYFGNFSVYGGRAPYSVQLGSGNLPDGVTVGSSPAYASTFNVTGRPTKDGTFQFTLKVSDSYETPNTATQNYQIRVSEPLAISGPGQVGILYNQNYSATFPATGGIPPYTWIIDNIPPRDMTPPGFTFDTTTGSLSGTPTVAGCWSPDIAVHDSSNPPQSAFQFGFNLCVYGKLTVVTSFLPTITTGRNTSLGILSTGGAGPFQWSISSGSLPPGMNFNSISFGNFPIISGLPAQAGSYTFTLALSDGNTGDLHQTTSLQLTMTVKDPGQMTRNDALSVATPLSNIVLLASISPYSDPSTVGPDVDVFSASAVPGSRVLVGVLANNGFVEPLPPYNFLLPVLEIVDNNGVRYQACGGNTDPFYPIPFNKPCINGLPGTSFGGPLFSSSASQSLQVPGTGTTPVTFYIRVSDARGDARPDFIYTLYLSGVN